MIWCAISGMLSTMEEDGCVLNDFTVLYGLEVGEDKEIKGN